MSNLTLASLFDGSGGFPLGGMLAGITPVWSSEIEPFPIRVTTKRMPFIKHYGNVSEINGAEVEPVDIITFGSPCQDMSVAGKRAGLEGSRSNLFYEAIRIVKEMRCATDGRYPRYIVWENVPGAFISNRGEDFRCVLEAICSVKDETASVPECGKWLQAGYIMGDGYSAAWRVLDAQYWGVPQRRKRIYLVADFADKSAPEILFESEGLSGYSAESFRSWQSTAGGAEEGAGETGIIDDVPQSWNGSQTSPTLTANNAAGQQRMPDKENFNCILHPNNKEIYAVTLETFHCATDEEKSMPLKARDYKDPVCVSYGIGRDAFNQGKNAQYKPAIEEELQPTIVAKGPGAVAAPFGFYPQMKAECVTLTEEKATTLVNGTCPGRHNGVIDMDYSVRRLTPVECARLQGFPDWWCAGLETEEPDNKELRFWYDVFSTYARLMKTKPKTVNQVRKWLKDPYADSAAYKMWGNGVALPCVYFVLAGIGYYAQKAH